MASRPRQGDHTLLVAAGAAGVAALTVAGAIFMFNGTHSSKGGEAAETPSAVSAESETRNANGVNSAARLVPSGDPGGCFPIGCC